MLSICDKHTKIRFDKVKLSQRVSRKKFHSTHKRCGKCHYVHTKATTMKATHWVTVTTTRKGVKEVRGSKMGVLRE